MAQSADWGLEMNDSGVPEITPDQLKQRLDTGEPLVLIDVRERHEWEISNLEAHGALLIPLGDLPDRLDEIDADADIVVYCRTGNRSGGAVRWLRARGYQNVWNLSGGINDWAIRIDPEMPTY